MPPMPMTPAELKRATIVQLRAARTAMMSPDWTEKVKVLPLNEQQDAARLLFQTHHAINELANKQLSEIRDKLIGNEKALGEGIDNLKKQLRKIEKIAATIKAISEFLVIVARVVKLVAKA
ncbi:MAG TPA: hypothetical protein VFZ07_04070 [Dongiaceae bacterium]